MKKHGDLISLEQYTRERCHEFYRQYVSDPMMTKDIYSYDFQQVEYYYDKKVLDSSRTYFGIINSEEIIGEILLKHIDLEKRTGTLSIILVNDSIKNKGYGTEAIKLLLDYAFRELNFDVVLADAVLYNTRSKHVLDKIGFVHTHDDNKFSYYKCSKQ